MYIGRLNKTMQNSSCTVFKRDTGKTPAIKQNGNPLLGQTLEVDWKELYEAGAEIHVSLGGTYDVNEILLTLGPRCYPIGLRLLSADRSREYSHHFAETGKDIRDTTVALAIEDRVDSFIIEWDIKFYSVIVENLEIFGSKPSELTVFPTPKSLTLGEGRLSLTDVTAYAADGALASAAAPILEEKWKEQAGQALTSAVNAGLILRDNATIATNGYRLEIKPSGVLLEASDLRGMVYGVEVLCKLIDGQSLPVCTVDDAPYMPFRGVHLYVPAADEMEFTKRLIKYVISPMGYNVIIMEVAGALRYDSHPKINEKMLESVEKSNLGIWPRMDHTLAKGQIVEKALVKELIDYCRSFGIEVIPEIHSLSHVQFMTHAYPEIAERPEGFVEQKNVDLRVADAMVSDFYPHCYCPSTPRSYEILFDLIDEVVELFEPKEYVHMGHDEVYQIGVCSRCKDRDPADLFLEDIQKIHDYLAKKGLKMMIWSDMLQPITKYHTHSARHRMPKDIVYLDFIWYFHFEKDIEDNLLPEGNPLAYGNLYSSHFPRYESRIAKDGVYGGQISAWVETCEEDLGREGKIYDFLYTGQMLWSDMYTSHARYAYDLVLRDMMPTLRQKLGARRYPSLQEGATEQVIADNGVYCPEHSETGGRFVANTCAKSLIFEHTATQKIMRYPWIPCDVIGYYEVIYADGTTETIPVEYAKNISHYDRRHDQPFGHKYYRHNGYTATYFIDAIERPDSLGRPNTTYRYEWINPKPDVAIESVSYVSNDTFPTDVFVSRIVAVN